MTYKFKQMKVKFSELKVGDYVLSKDRTCHYLVTGKSKTLLHGHDKIRVLYPSPYEEEYETIIILGRTDIRTIIRPMVDVK